MDNIISENDIKQNTGKTYPSSSHETSHENSNFISCKICGSSLNSPSFSYHDFFYVKCSSCEFVYQNPQPSQKETFDIYNDEYFEYEIENQNAFFKLMKLSLKDINFNHISRQFSHPKRFLDIGCATGLLLNYMKKQDWLTFGVEICKRSADYARSNFKLNIISTPLQQAAFQSNFFHVVHLSHLIEHVNDPAALIDEIYRITIPGGFVIITTPNVDGLFAKIYRSSWRSAIKEHLFLFSKKTLAQLLQKKGFFIHKQLSWGAIPIEKNKNKFVKSTFDKLVKQFNLGDVMLFLAQKKYST